MISIRILGIDYGERRTGIAISDPSGRIAQGLEVINGGSRKTIPRICRIAQEYGVKTIVVGFPINMDATVGFMAERTNVFISALREYISDDTVDIVTLDERLTSAEAARTIKTIGKKPSSREVREKGTLDVLAAAILLQSFLDKLNYTQSNKQEGEKCE